MKTAVTCSDKALQKSATSKRCLPLDPLSLMSHSCNIAVVSLQPDDCSADLLNEGGSQGSAPSLPHCIKH